MEPFEIEQACQAAVALYQTGDLGQALKLFAQILAVDPDHQQACYGLAYARFPGDSYPQVLSRFHDWLKPATYLEIGVETGKTLALCKPPTKALGIDPAPVIKVAFQAQTRVFAGTSDQFFRNHNLAEVFGQDTVDLVFIDGMHLFDYVLRDFIHVEKFASAETVVLIHDCLPLNAITAERKRRTTFWTGDVWKMVPCLAKYRPDLNWFVIPAAPTGLMLVNGLNPRSSILAERISSVCNEFESMPFDYGVEDRNRVFRVVQNDWNAIQARMREWGLSPG